MPLLDHFELIAPLYDRVVKIGDIQKLIRTIQLPVRGRVLDVGGGTGRISQHFVDLASQIIVVDLSIGMLTQAKLKGGLLPVCASANALPFPDQSFDRIIVVDALHHMQQQARSLNELWRVLANNGRIVIEEFNINSLLVKLAAWMEKLLLMHSHFISAESIQSHFDAFEARKSIFKDRYNAWVIIDKIPKPERGKLG